MEKTIFKFHFDYLNPSLKHVMIHGIYNPNTDLWWMPKKQLLKHSLNSLTLVTTQGTLGDHSVTNLWPHGNHMDITLQTLGDHWWILLVGDHFVTVCGLVMCKSSTRVCINLSIISVGVLRYYPSIQLAKIIRVHITNEDHLVTTLWLQGDQLTAWRSFGDHSIAF